MCVYLCHSAMEFESRIDTTFNQANTKRPEEITLREEVPTCRRFNFLDAVDDFGGLCLCFFFLIFILHKWMLQRKRACEKDHHVLQY